jgi:hypothetical protein
MDENRNTSITLFVLMGLAFLFIVIYVFVIAPKGGERNTLGRTDLVLESPIQKWNLNYSEEDILPFCGEGEDWLGIGVKKGSSVFSTSDGMVVDILGNIVTIDAGSDINIQYYPVSNYSVFVGDKVSAGDVIGKTNSEYLKLRVNDLNREVYECPYNYLNKFSRSVLDSVGEELGFEVVMCECDTLDY